MPLMAVVDWRGFHLVAMSLLPIGGESLVYGLLDGGITVLAKHQEFNELMKEAAKKLNIKVGRGRRREEVGVAEGEEGQEGSKREAQDRM